MQKSDPQYEFVKTHQYQVKMKPPTKCNNNNYYKSRAITLQDYNVNSCDLPGYKAEHIYRHTKVGGGVAFYIKDNIAYHTRLDITKLNDYIECQFIEIHKDSNSYGKDIIVGVIYRPPNNDINKCIDEMSNILDIPNNENKLCYIMGDFNINLFNHEVHAPTCNF